MMTALWIVLALLMLAGFAVAAWRVQTAPSVPRKVMAGVGGALLAFMGIALLLAVLAN